MYKKLKSLLLEAGLNEAEVILYMELLKKPSANKWELVSRSGLDKNKVYRAFDRLHGFKMIEKTDLGVEPLSLDCLIKNLESKQKKTKSLADKIKDFSPFLKVPVESINEFEICDSEEEIIDKYMMMSEIKYNTNLDFGDLENFVPVLGGLEPVLKFRQKRYNQNAKNIAICTTVGPYTSCMSRKQDLKMFKSNIDLLKVDFKGKWVIFSDTSDYVMFNNFSVDKNPSSVLVKSKVIADTQRMQFDQFMKNMNKF
ncbi:hypothetical protein GF366_04645 [Candidatus Peregrinibacteria bacterium]|nr:hypothetical protein [Candidatus Peregrinibacteria bacterium]